jgi:hypothetical protein
MSRRILIPACAAAALLLASACATTGPAGPAGPGPVAAAPATPAVPPPAASVAPAPALAGVSSAQVKLLQDEVFRLVQLREAEVADYRRRLAAVERERDLAVAEVVRLRARMQGMVSAPEAGAMYAEARVLLDRMEEDAYSAQARDQLRTARQRLEEGKAEMGKGNPGGAAFLFDQMGNLYESFRKGSPRRLTVTAVSVDMKAAASAPARAVATLYRNDALEGLAKTEGWVQVRDFSGRKGWVPWEVVR